MYLSVLVSSCYALLRSKSLKLQMFKTVYLIFIILHCHIINVVLIPHYYILFNFGAGRAYLYTCRPPALFHCNCIVWWVVLNKGELWLATVYYTELWASTTWPSNGCRLRNSISHWFLAITRGRKSLCIANTWLILRSTGHALLRWLNVSFGPIPNAYLVWADTKY